MAKINCHYSLLLFSSLPRKHFFKPSKGKQGHKQVIHDWCICTQRMIVVFIYLVRLRVDWFSPRLLRNWEKEDGEERKSQGSLSSEEDTEQPGLLAKVLLFVGKGVFVWTNEIMFFIINNQVRHHTNLCYL